MTSSYPPIKRVYWNKVAVVDNVEDEDEEAENVNLRQYTYMDGLIITFQDPEEPPIYILLENKYLCCETFEITGGDDLRQLRDGEIISKVAYNNQREQELRSFETTYACLDIICESGLVLPIDAWCRHNGYYPHDLVIQSREIKETQSL